ncbi:MAG: BlaI/MecI/CopY family transcriptional regulator [Candidatus Sumerlaeia bacterium]|nr:BlaI/MecI/CopY family transcriptional regulator [Candidatus Sumerlaeia bacterium]
MSDTNLTELSRRERQIMDIVFARGRATAAEVQEGLSDPPSYSAVRALLRVLNEKGHLNIERDGARYVYVPTANREATRKSALGNVLQTFFNGSLEDAVATLLTLKQNKLTPEELDRLSELVDEARKEGR